jgi:hypothetical protein
MSAASQPADSKIKQHRQSLQYSNSRRSPGAAAAAAAGARSTGGDIEAALAHVDQFINLQYMSSNAQPSRAPPPPPAGGTGTGSTVKPTRPTFLSPVPFWGTILLSVGAGVILLCCFAFCCAYLCRKSRGGGRKKGTPKIPGAPSASTRSQKVQPDLEDLLGHDENENKEEDYLGKLHFTVDYNLSSSQLSVTVIEGQKLPAMDIGGSSDPYVKVCLLPANKPTNKPHETKVHYKTLQNV